MALAPWLAQLANQLEGSHMNRQANVNMESGNQGAYSAPHSQFTEMDYAANPKLENVSQDPEIKGWEQSNMESDTQKTQSRVEELIRFRENEAKKDSNIEGQYAVPKAKHSVANQSGRKTYSRLDLAKLARAASGDVLDSIEEIIDDAESFVHKHVPLGQREQVFAAITKALAKNGMDVRFTVMAKSEAPQSGFDHYTMKEVASYIEDDYRTVPKSWNMSMPEGNSNHNPTSIQRVVTKNPTVESVRAAKTVGRKSLAKSLMGLEQQLKATLTSAKSTTERKFAQQMLNQYKQLSRRYAMDEDMPEDTDMSVKDTGAEDDFDMSNDFEDDMAIEEEHVKETSDMSQQLRDIASELRDGSMTSEDAADQLDSLANEAQDLSDEESEELEEMEKDFSDESDDDFSDESDEFDNEFDDESADESEEDEMAPTAFRKNRFVRGR